MALIQVQAPKAPRQYNREVLESRDPEWYGLQAKSSPEIVMFFEPHRLCDECWDSGRLPVNPGPVNRATSKPGRALGIHRLCGLTQLG